MLAWALGQVAWTVYALQGVSCPTPPCPTSATSQRCRLLAVGVLTWPRRRSGWTGGAVLDGALTLAPWPWSPTPFPSSRSSSRASTGAQAWLGFFYPASELALVAIVGAGLSSTAGPTAAAWHWSGSDCSRSRLPTPSSRSMRSTGRSRSSLTNGGWTFAFAAMGAASLVPARLAGQGERTGSRVPRRRSRSRVSSASRPRVMRFASSASRAGRRSRRVVMGFLLVLVATRVFLFARTRSRDRTRELVRVAGGAARSAAHAGPLPRRARQRAGARGAGHRRRAPRRRRAAAHRARLPARARSAEDRSSQASRAHRTTPARSPRRSADSSSSCTRRSSTAAGSPRRSTSSRKDCATVGSTSASRRFRTASSARPRRSPTGSSRERSQTSAATRRHAPPRSSSAWTTGRSTAASARRQRRRADEHTSNGSALLVARKRAELAGGRFRLNAPRRVVEPTSSSSFPCRVPLATRAQPRERSLPRRRRPSRAPAGGLRLPRGERG